MSLLDEWFAYAFKCRDCGEEFGTMYADNERCYDCETIWQEHMTNDPCRCWPSRCSHASVR